MSRDQLNSISNASLSPSFSAIKQILTFSGALSDIGSVWGTTSMLVLCAVPVRRAARVTMPGGTRVRARCASIGALFVATLPSTLLLNYLSIFILIYLYLYMNYLYMIYMHVISMPLGPQQTATLKTLYIYSITSHRYLTRVYICIASLFVRRFIGLHELATRSAGH